VTVSDAAVPELRFSIGSSLDEAEPSPAIFLIGGLAVVRVAGRWLDMLDSGIFENLFVKFLSYFNADLFRNSGR
jgi:hypothetical protein